MLRASKYTTSDTTYAGIIAHGTDIMVFVPYHSEFYLGSRVSLFHNQTS